LPRFNVINNITNAHPYVKAIFALALQQGRLQEWQKLLELLRGVVADKLTYDIWLNPQIKPEQQLQFLNSFCVDFGAELQEQENNFLKLLAQKKHLNLIPQIYVLFKQCCNEYEKILPAKVVAASELTSEQLAKLQTSLENKFQRKIVISLSIDSELIGGAIIYVKDYVLDGSVSGRLKKLTAGIGF
jgi:F-type H+-transporting ATPase subunit delta